MQQQQHDDEHDEGFDQAGDGRGRGMSGSAQAVGCCGPRQQSQLGGRFWGGNWGSIGHVDASAKGPGSCMPRGGSSSQRRRLAAAGIGRSGVSGNGITLGPQQSPPLCSKQCRAVVCCELLVLFVPPTRRCCTSHAVECLNRGSTVMLP
jgi:hypothetical protein